MIVCRYEEEATTALLMLLEHGATEEELHDVVEGAIAEWKSAGSIRERAEDLAGHKEPK